VDGEHYDRVFYGLAALVAVLIFGTAGYVILEGWSLGDAFFMTVTTITTVGYREVRPLDSSGRLLTSVLIFTGVGTAFYILIALVTAIIEGDLRQVFGARRMRTTIQSLRDHYIVCGYGRVGREVALELKERGTAYLVIDLDPEALDRARQEGALTVHGDATSERVLSDAGVEHARSLIAASDSDATNIYITLTARALSPSVFIVTRVSTPEVEGKLRQAGAHRVVSPYAIGGRRMAYAAVQPMVSDFMDVVRGDSLNDRILAEFFIDEASPLEGATIGEVLKRCNEVVVLAVQSADGKFAVGPAISTRLAVGDRLIVVGDENELRAVGAVPSGR